MLYFGDHHGVKNAMKCGGIKTMIVPSDTPLTMKIVAEALRKFSDLRMVHL